MTQPARLENIRTLDPHSHAALTDLASRLGPSHEIRERALDFVCELRMLLVGGCLWPQGPKGTATGIGPTYSRYRCCSWCTALADFEVQYIFVGVHAQQRLFHTRAAACGR